MTNVSLPKVLAWLTRHHGVRVEVTRVPDADAWTVTSAWNGTPAGQRISGPDVDALAGELGVNQESALAMLVIKAAEAMHTGSGGVVAAGQSVPPADVAVAVAPGGSVAAGGSGSLVPPPSRRGFWSGWGKS